MAGTSGLRKKGIGLRTWLLLDSSGQTQVAEVGKQAIMRRTGLPARDLRILDPQLSYPSTVLGRERAIVINLEHIKAIITAQEVHLLNHRDPSVTPFVDELQTRILRHNRDVDLQSRGFTDNDSAWIDAYDGVGSQPKRNHFPAGEECWEQKFNGRQTTETRDRFKVLPFEFVALEACFEGACTCLDSEAKTLEREAHPALDKLTTKISTLNLERVRQIKSRLVAITGRVQKVRDELEHLLDDDEDMAEMYLSDKMAQRLDGSLDSMENDAYPTEDGPPESDERVRPDADSPGSEGHLRHLDSIQSRNFSACNTMGRESHTTVTTKRLDVEELEMLLEAYFVQIDGTLNKLSTLREYVDDTEDYINIMLDDKQNHLLQMGVMLTTATLVVSAFVVVAGIFGMNIGIDMFNDEEHGMERFLWTVGGGTAGSVFLYLVAIVWCKHNRLLE